MNETKTKKLGSSFNRYSFVRLCLDDKCIHPFRNYFQLIEHAIRTRNSSNLIRLPMIKTEYAKKVSLSPVQRVQYAAIGSS